MEILLSHIFFCLMENLITTFLVWSQFYELTRDKRESGSLAGDDPFLYLKYGCHFFRCCHASPGLNITIH